MASALSTLEFTVATVARPWVLHAFSRVTHAVASVATTLILSCDRTPGAGSRVSRGTGFQPVTHGQDGRATGLWNRPLKFRRAEGLLPQIAGDCVRYRTQST